MTKVKIAEFKSRLSKYLRQVRMGGEVVVMDRDTPIARVVPIETLTKKQKLIIRPAKGSLKDWAKLSIPPALPGVDSLQALLADREDDLDEYVTQFVEKHKR